MLKDYVLGIEIAKYGNMDVANLSMAISDYGLVEGVDYLKFGGVTLFWTKSIDLPKYIKELINNNEFIDLSEYIPKTMFIDILDNNTRMITNMYEETEFGSYTDNKGKEKRGKKFIKILDPELKRVCFDKRLAKYVVQKSEISELLEKEYIQGYLDVSTTSSLTWY